MSSIHNVKTRAVHKILYNVLLKGGGGVGGRDRNTVNDIGNIL